MKDAGAAARMAEIVLDEARLNAADAAEAVGEGPGRIPEDVLAAGEAVSGVLPKAGAAGLPEAGDGELPEAGAAWLPEAVPGAGEFLKAWAAGLPEAANGELPGSPAGGPEASASVDGSGTGETLAGREGRLPESREGSPAEGSAAVASSRDREAGSGSGGDASGDVPVAGGGTAGDASGSGGVAAEGVPVAGGGSAGDAFGAGGAVEAGGRQAPGVRRGADFLEVLEVGPGLGALTRPLLELGLGVRAVELDRGLCQQLSGWPDASSGALSLLCYDVLKLPTDSGIMKGVRCVCGNLPYGITTPFLFWFLEATGGRVPGVFMVQKEVADRLAAPPGTKEYGRLSVALGSWFEAREAFVLGPRSFHPRPKVESAVAVLRPLSDLPDLSPGALGRMTKICFHSRRKTLANNLFCGFPRDRAMAALDALGMDGSRRPEEFSPLDYQRLTRELGEGRTAPGEARDARRGDRDD
ncbi:MAG: 16S rRNA (adenine(1518)-N(6)/adenine(1519)-N(6))-dimethyltransferase RsmA [Deltaproteobacteria bacterium]|nr:16S rRNA (adenine(1518)-N(6)/adenine(1519)-N(6))-dimethyltransferase RsmA [Deltaproteobacteria bacterium]